MSFTLSLLSFSTFNVQDAHAEKAEGKVLSFPKKPEPKRSACVDALTGLTIPDGSLAANLLALQNVPESQISAAEKRSIHQLLTSMHEEAWGRWNHLSREAGHFKTLASGRLFRARDLSLSLSVPRERKAHEPLSLQGQDFVYKSLMQKETPLLNRFIALRRWIDNMGDSPLDSEHVQKLALETLQEFHPFDLHAGMASMMSQFESFEGVRSLSSFNLFPPDVQLAWVGQFVTAAAMPTAKLSKESLQAYVRLTGDLTQTLLYMQNLSDEERVDFEKYSGLPRLMLLWEHSVKTLLKEEWVQDSSLKESLKIFRRVSGFKNGLVILGHGCVAVMSVMNEIQKESGNQTQLLTVFGQYRPLVPFLEIIRTALQVSDSDLSAAWIGETQDQSSDYTIASFAEHRTYISNLYAFLILFDPNIPSFLDQELTQLEAIPVTPSIRGELTLESRLVLITRGWLMTLHWSHTVHDSQVLGRIIALTKAHASEETRRIVFKIINQQLKRAAPHLMQYLANLDNPSHRIIHD